ncbi:hypothetical protein AAVH_21176 [Aphelenchoides avenae]|nr:hypothetical protein AAVH_21176 [Aphelenchus avenae]
MGNKSGKEQVPAACTDEPDPGVTNAFEHDELFPLKAYEGHLGSVQKLRDDHGEGGGGVADDHARYKPSVKKKCPVIITEFLDDPLLRINEVFQKEAEALEEFESRKDNRGKRLSFLLPSNFRFVDAPPNESVSKGRYTGFAMKAVLVENGVTVKQAKKCEKTRHLLAPEIKNRKSATATSASYSLCVKYFDALRKKMKLVKTKDNAYHFVEEATMHKDR